MVACGSDKPEVPKTIADVGSKPAEFALYLSSGEDEKLIGGWRG